MSSEGIPVTPPVAIAAHITQQRVGPTFPAPPSKSVLPSGPTTTTKSVAALEKAATASANSGSATAIHGKGSTAAAAVTNSKAVPAKATDSSTLVTQLNSTVNDSGRPNEFRLDTSSGAAVIQEINPSTGQVIGEYSEAEFPTLAQGLGLAGVLVNTRA